MHIPVFLYKVGFKGVYIAWACFPDEKKVLFLTFSLRSGLFSLLLFICSAVLSFSCPWNNKDHNKYACDS